MSYQGLTVQIATISYIKNAEIYSTVNLPNKVPWILHIIACANVLGITKCPIVGEALNKFVISVPVYLLFGIVYFVCGTLVLKCM